MQCFTTYQANSIIKTQFNTHNDIMLLDGEFLSNCLKYICKHPDHNNENGNNDNIEIIPPITNTDKYLCTESYVLMCTEGERLLIV